MNIRHFLLLSFFLFGFFNTQAQSGMLIQPTNWSEYQILAGQVTVLDSVYAMSNRDSVRKYTYEHYLIAEQLKDTIFYYEVFKSGTPVRYFKNAYRFSIEETSLLFFDRTEYLDFPDIGKLLFLYKKEKTDSTGSLAFPVRRIASDSLDNFPHRDSSFFSLIRIRGDKRSHSMFLRDSLAEEHFIFIKLMEKNLYRDRQNIYALKLETTHHPLFFENKKMIVAEAVLDKQAGFYKSLKVKTTTIRNQKVNGQKVRTDQKSIRSYVYKKVRKLPDDIKDQLQQLKKQIR